MCHICCKNDVAMAFDKQTEASVEPSAIDLMGVKVHAFTITQLHQTIAQVIVQKRQAIVANVNINAMNLAQQLPWFRNFINCSEYVFCDGHGVMLGARLCGLHLPEKITYAHWFPLFCEFCATKGYSIFFLGGRPGIAEQAKTRLQNMIPELKIAGVHHGYFCRELGSTENLDIIEHINNTHADVLLTSFGMPLQEKWLQENRAAIKTHIMLTGGACLDYMAGASKRPPSWLTDTGFEWLGRMLYEPRRLWKRYLLGNPLFFWHLLCWRLKQRMTATTELK